MKNCDPVIINQLFWFCLFISLTAIKLILDLKHYDVKAVLLTGLVALLRPIKEKEHQHQISKGDIRVWLCAVKAFNIHLFLLTNYGRLFIF